MQYLSNKYPTEELQRDLGCRLDLFYKRDTMLYSDRSDLISPQATNVLAPTELVYKLSDCGISDACTSKGAPRLHTSLKLIDEILTSGYVTSGDALTAWPNPATEGYQYFWLSWVKGQQRSCTAVSMADICMDKYQTPSAFFSVDPELFHSFQHVRVRNANVPPDVMSVAFTNALLSYRGSL